MNWNEPHHLTHDEIGWIVILTMLAAVWLYGEGARRWGKKIRKERRY